MHHEKMAAGCFACHRTGCSASRLLSKLQRLGHCCDNTGTCRLAGYQADEIEPPVSILFTRQAGANAAVIGEVSLLPFNDDDRQLACVAAVAN